MESRICLILGVFLALCSSALALPVISGPNTIEIDGPPITLTLSGTIDDIYGFESFVWVNYSEIHPDTPYIVRPPDEDEFKATVGGEDSYIDLYWWDGPDYQGGGVGFGAIPDASETIPVGEWFTFDVTRRSQQVGEVIYVNIVSADLYDILSYYPVTVVSPEPTTVVFLTLGGLAVLRRRRRQF
jgi:hypothetical protein